MIFIIWVDSDQISLDLSRSGFVTGTSRNEIISSGWTFDSPTGPCIFLLHHNDYKM